MLDGHNGNVTYSLQQTNYNEQSQAKAAAEAKFFFTNLPYENMDDLEEYGRRVVSPDSAGLHEQP